MRVIQTATMLAVIGIGFTAGAQAQPNCVPVGPKDPTTGITPMHCTGTPPTNFNCLFTRTPGGVSVDCTGNLPNDACGEVLVAYFKICAAANDEGCYEKAFGQWKQCEDK